MKALNIILLYCFFMAFASAETCPTLYDIQNEHFKEHDWRVLNLNSGEELTLSEWKKIKPGLKYFAMAQWRQDAPEGHSQCYYKKNRSDYEMEVYFVKNTGPPDVKLGHWHSMGEMLQCESEIMQCRFQDAG